MQFVSIYSSWSPADILYYMSYSVLFCLFVVSGFVSWAPFTPGITVRPGWLDRKRTSETRDASPAANCDWIAYMASSRERLSHTFITSSLPLHLFSGRNIPKRNTFHNRCPIDMLVILTNGDANESVSSQRSWSWAFFTPARVNAAHIHCYQL